MLQCKVLPHNVGIEGQSPFPPHRHEERVEVLRESLDKVPWTPTRFPFRTIAHIDGIPYIWFYRPLRLSLFLPDSSQPEGCGYKNKNN
jgi:hypothetical protein